MRRELTDQAAAMARQRVAAPGRRAAQRRLLPPEFEDDAAAGRRWCAAPVGMRRAAGRAVRSAGRGAPTGSAERLPFAARAPDRPGRRRGRRLLVAVALGPDQRVVRRRPGPAGAHLAAVPDASRLAAGSPSRAVRTVVVDVAGKVRRPGVPRCRPGPGWSTPSVVPAVPRHGRRPDQPEPGAGAGRRRADPGRGRPPLHRPGRRPRARRPEPPAALVSLNPRPSNSSRRCRA